ncbi:branched-chain amino acid ABC transporter permease [Thermodesulfobacteriota bacterium]
MFEQIIITGLVTSGVYSLLAIGFSLVIGVAKIVNLAHTAAFMLAAYFVYVFSVMLEMSPILSMILAILLPTIIGVVCYNLTMNRVQVHETAVLLVTIGLAMLFQELIFIIFGSHYKGIQPILPGYLELLGIRVSKQHLLTFIAAMACLIFVWTLLSKTRLGLYIRATAQDREIANLMGVNPSRINVITIAIATALAALAGVIVAPLSILEPHMWTSPLIIIIAIAVLGGLGSVKGSIIGAFILGFAETIVVFTAPEMGFLRTSVALSVMVLVLVIRPEGLFGVAFEEERL